MTMPSPTSASISQFIDAIKALLDTNDMTDINKLSTRLRPYRIETCGVTVDGEVMFKSILILEEEQPSR